MSCSTSSRCTGEVDSAVAVRAQEEGEGRDEKEEIGRKKKKYPFYLDSKQIKCVQCVGRGNPVM